MQSKPKWIIIVQGILMLLIPVAPIATGYRFFFPNNLLDWVGTIASIIGLILVLMSMRALRKSFTIQAAVKDHTKLVTDFPFNISRNPMYLGGLIMCFSWSLLQRSSLAAVLSLLLLALLNHKVKIEERNLKIVFGDEYQRYKTLVSRFI